MILITVGSQKFQFNRLLSMVDKLIESGVIKDEVFAQIGVSDYVPQHFKYIDFMTQSDFQMNMEKSDIIITHAGTGVIVRACKMGKKVIAIPRLKKYQEHVDDHQIQLVQEFAQLNFIEPVYDINELENALKNVNKKVYNKYISNTDAILSSIEQFIDEN